MATIATPERDWTEVFKEEKPIDFYHSQSDPTHFIVRRYLKYGDKEVIGHVYIEFEGDYFRYVSTNSKGREIFPPTYDFNEVDRRFTRHAQVLALRQKPKDKQLNKNQTQLKNLNVMKTSVNNPEQKPKRENQIITIEYEKAKGDGHIVTMVDSYHNVLGRIHKIYNDQSKQYEYVAYDHAGNPYAKGDKLWQVKKEFTDNRTQLLEEAHQRRITAKEQTVQHRQNSKEERTTEKSAKGQSLSKEQSRNQELSKQRSDDRSLEKSNAKEDSQPKGESKGDDRADGEINKQEEREQELEDLREEREDDRGDMDIDR